MCVIIHKPQNETLSQNVLRQCFNRNKDGAGLVVNGEHCEKGFFKFNSLWKQVQKYQDEDLIIHCRYATSGPVNKRFCHPFKINSGFLFHNGVIKGLGTKQKSDTYKLALMLNEFKEEQEDILERLSEKTKSRFVLVSKTSMQKFGQWYDQDGLSFSNLRWMKPKKSTYLWNSQLCWQCGQSVFNYKVFCTNCGAEVIK